MSSHKFENDDHNNDHEDNHTEENDNNDHEDNHTEENDNHDDDNSSEQHTQENGSDDHNLSTANPGIQGNGSLEKIIAASFQNTTGVNAISSNEFENFVNASTQDNETDDHNLSTANPGVQGNGSLEKIIATALQNTSGVNAISSNEFENFVNASTQDSEIHGNNTVGNVIKGSDGDDILIGGGNTDTGENHLNGGDGDDILVAGGSKTSQLEQFFADHQDIADSVNSNQKLTDVASLINSATNNSGNGVHNIFDVHSGSGHDQIFNFHAATDKVQLDRGLNGSDINDIDSLLQHIHISGNDLSIDLGGGNSITLVGVDVSGLTANNVAFV